MNAEPMRCAWDICDKPLRLFCFNTEDDRCFCDEICAMRCFSEEFSDEESKTKH